MVLGCMAIGLCHVPRILQFSAPVCSVCQLVNEDHAPLQATQAADRVGDWATDAGGDVVQ